MRTRMIVLALAVAMLFLAGTVLAQALSAYQIAKKSLELDKTSTKVTTYQMTVINKRGNKKVYKFKVWQKVFPDGEKKLLRFLEPADDAGTGLLTFEQRNTDDLQWLFLPSVRKARRLAAADRSSEFMGSDLYFEDLSALSADEYEHKLLSEVMLGGVACYLIESKPKPGINSAYALMRSWIDKQTFIGQKIEMYDKNGKLLKTMATKRVQQVDGIWTIMEAEITRVNMGQAKTLMTTVERQYNVEIPNNYFTTQFLENY